MSNRRFEMYQYRNVIHRMRMGESDRIIALAKLMGRGKCKQVRRIAEQNGWLGKEPLPDDEILAAAFEIKPEVNPTHVSLSFPFTEQIRQWVEQGVRMTTIYRALVDRFGFRGSYSSVRRLVERLRIRQPQASCMLDFEPGEAAQVDFGKGPTIVDAFTGVVLKTWIFVMSLCFSRHVYAEVVTNQNVSTWPACVFRRNPPPDSD